MAKCAPLNAALLPATAGTYCAWLWLDEPVRVPIGALGELALPAGLAGYAGSALGSGGLRARAGRHLRAGKPLRWHIDWLTAVVPVCAVWYRAAPQRLECAWAAALRQAPGAALPLRGFGASDCACAAHLITVPVEALGALWTALAPDGALGTLP